jgi:hypothetical protein
MSTETFEQVLTLKVRNYGDRRLGNIRHSAKLPGSREYFDKVERRKYFVEPHIPRFAEFPRLQNKRVLGIGCGNGTEVMNFARYGVPLSTRYLAIGLVRGDHI